MEASGGSTGPKRTPAQRDLDAERISAWMAEGRSTRWIGKQLGLSHFQVIQDQKKLRRAALGRAGLTMDVELERSLTALDEALRWASDGWEKSRQPYEATVTEQVDGPKGRTTRVVLQRHTPPGDAAFIRAFIEANTRRDKLLGLEAAAKTELSGPQGGPLRVANKDDGFDWDAFHALQQAAFGGSNGNGHGANGAE